VLENNFRERYGTVEPMTIPGFYPSIIDLQLLERVQVKLRDSAANWRNSYANRTTYLMSGLVVCDPCGSLCGDGGQGRQISLLQLWLISQGRQGKLRRAAHQ
jgi:hypothetical protein